MEDPSTNARYEVMAWWNGEGHERLGNLAITPRRVVDREL